MTQDRDAERRRLAYRLAGKAVAHHAQGRLPGALTLQQALEEEAGRPWPVDLGGRARHRLELEILARWAGLLSEGRACFDGGEPPGGWGPAMVPLATMGRRVTRSDEENQAYLEWLRRRALGMIDLPELWAAVEALAERLLAAGAVGSGEAAALIGGVQQARRPRSGPAGWFRRPGS